MQPIISIIIPCYNGEKYLRETLDCLQKQTIQDWECIIVNDGSSDNSIEIMKEYADRDERYRYIDKKNEGPAIARNIGIAEASGKYILPLDADDIIEPTYSEKAVSYLGSHKCAKLVYCIAEFFGAKSGIWELPKYNYQDLPYENGIFCSCVYRKSDFEKTSGYNPNMYKSEEDWDFLLSLLSEEDEVFQIPEVLFLYRQHGKSRSIPDFDKNFEMHLQMVLNHPDIYAKDIIRTKNWLDNSKYYKTEIEKIQDSLSYKLGSYLALPLRKLRDYKRFIPF